MTRYRVGDRVGVIQGALTGYYGKVSDNIIDPRTGAYLGPLIRVTGCADGNPNPRFLRGEWCLPNHYITYVD